MAVCIHGNVCKKYWDKHHVILSRSCPKRCEFFEEKYKNNMRKDFINYCKKEFNKEIKFEKSDNPTTFDSLFRPNKNYPNS